MMEMAKEIRETLVFVNIIPSGQFQVIQRALHTYFFPQTKIALPKTSTLRGVKETASTIFAAGL